MKEVEIFKYLLEKYNVNSFYIGYVKKVHFKPYDGDATIIIGNADDLVEDFYHTVLLKISDGSFVDIIHPENEIVRGLEPNHEGYVLEYIEPITEYCDSEIKNKVEIFGFRARLIGYKNFERFEQNRRLSLVNRCQGNEEEVV